jgi:hypothetical protein
MKMSSEIESNAQFDMLHVLLCLFLYDERTLNYFIHNCVISIIVFAESLFEKEPYMENYTRMLIKISLPPRPHHL